MNHVRSSRGK